MLRWLLFDIGSTLLDETDAIRARAETSVEALRGTPQECNFDTFWTLMSEAAAAGNAHPYHSVMKTLGSDVFMPWRKELEYPYPDALGLLEFLYPQYRLGIIANQSAGARQHLGRWNLDKYFDVIIASSEVGIAKPDLRIFQTALSQANCNPENAVMIGDRLDNDIYPAKQLGMKTIWVRQGWGGMPEPASEEYQPNYTASSLTKIVPALIKLTSTSNRDQIIL
ncbi:MAG: HAD-IA family hydrolase [Oscillospiraceae bacterium]|jgi:FMN phosphatase YigB (HAD superfamily)|nr:HAD-IA family hydrolase [Oscillospiraceae bacterium]